MLIVCSLADAERAFAAHRPARVISLLSDGDAAPPFDQAARRLTLVVDREISAEEIAAAARERAEAIIGFLKDWDGAGGVLIHCHRGISRSMAAAFIIMCMRAQEACERMLAAEMRKRAPHADPCPLLVSYADALLARDGRMIEAIEDLPAPRTAISAPISLLPA